jgi:hypothetical protein
VGFNGNTALALEAIGGDTISFSANGPSLGGLDPLSPGGSYQPPTFAIDSGFGGGQVPSQFIGSVTGGMTGDQISVMFTSPQVSMQLRGQVSPDGSAHGTVGENGVKWDARSPLKCMSTATSGTSSA